MVTPPIIFSVVLSIQRSTLRWRLNLPRGYRIMNVRHFAAEESGILGFGGMESTLDGFVGALVIRSESSWYMYPDRLLEISLNKSVAEIN